MVLLIKINFSEKHFFHDEVKQWLIDHDYKVDENHPINFIPRVGYNYFVNLPKRHGIDCMYLIYSKDTEGLSYAYEA